MIVIKIAWYCNKDKPSYQWNKIECLETNPEIYDQSIFSNGTKSNKQSKKAPSTIAIGVSGQLHVQK